MPPSLLGCAAPHSENQSVRYYSSQCHWFSKSGIIFPPLRKMFGTGGMCNHPEEWGLLPACCIGAERQISCDLWTISRCQKYPGYKHHLNPSACTLTPSVHAPPSSWKIFKSTNIILLPTNCSLDPSLL